MDFYNSYKTFKNINWDKFKLELRVSKITLFRFQFDISNKGFDINILGLGIRNK